MAKDWTKISSKYKGLWVALEEDEKTVISSAKTAKDALMMSIEKGYNRPILMRVPKSIVSYVG